MFYRISALEQLVQPTQRMKWFYYRLLCQLIYHLRTDSIRNWTGFAENRLIMFIKINLFL